jgi:hypothetical protein
MPIAVFAMLVFAIFTWLGAGTVESVMNDFAHEVGMPTWVFIAIPGLLSMLFSFLLYKNAARKITAMRESMTRALLVGIATWIGVAAMISYLWCPGSRTLACTSDVLLVSGIVGGGPLLVAVLVAGFVVGTLVLRRVTWLTYEPPPPKHAE